ncbi:acid-sensing ion channel 4-like [Brachionus plicatilis]|uniref:Acid-sensing ion channel 4-like n=1 Tax=Brachionus plicatilis TaxID=10195 RepID=A0A3M7P8J1_BRAPC|nr:acid-sensing ion channel 4-like [Brachionus plicatilis]
MIGSEIRNTVQPGSYGGLHVELYVGVPDDENTMSYSQGAHVFIDDNHFLPLRGEGIALAPGTFSNIVFKRTMTKLKPQPYSECIDNLKNIDSFDSEYYRKVFRSNLTYRQIECFHAYIQSEIYDKCKCDDINFNLIAEHSAPCLTIDQQLCGLVTYNKITLSNYKSKLKNYCPLECESVKLDFFKSENLYPSYSYGKKLGENDKIKDLLKRNETITIKQLQSNILAISFYYERIVQTEITESASITWDGLISSIGGTLGLFLGMSFLSLFEIFDFCLQIFFHLTEKKKNLLKN